MLLLRSKGINNFQKNDHNFFYEVLIKKFSVKSTLVISAKKYRHHFRVADLLEVIEPCHSLILFVIFTNAIPHFVISDNHRNLQPP